jgi:hypothetical protein
MAEIPKHKNFNDIKCLWMECGVVEYRLCDNNFECENCEFDRKFKSRLNKKENIRDEIESIFDNGHYTVPFTHPHYHFDNGLVIKNFIGNNFYIGLEPYVVKLIDRSSIISYVTSGNMIFRGDPLLSIKNGWGVVNLLSPFTFRFVEKLNIDNIFSNGLRWFAIIETEKSDVIYHATNEKQYFEKMYDTKNAMKEYALASETTGATMYDGGKPLEHWSDIIGKDNYRKFMTKVFS